MLGSDLVLNASGDLDVVGGLKMRADVLQAVRIALRFVKGEWFLDLNAGVPYFDDILGVKNPNLTHITSDFREAILGVEGVRSILSLNVKYEATTRSVLVTFRADTDQGQISFTEVL